MPYYLYTSNKLESFIPLISDIVLKRPFFEPAIIITQNKAMENWLKIKIAGYNGISGNIIFKDQESARELIFSFYKKSSELFKDRHIPTELEFIFILFQLLEEIKEKDEDKFSSLKGYIYNSEFAETVQNLKRVQLAEKIAGLFLSYAKTREEMTESWLQNKRFIDENNRLNVYEEWQMYLWNKIFSSNKNLYPYNEQFKEIINTGEKIEVKKPVICIFGSAFLLENIQKLLSFVSNDSAEIHHFLLSPCESYWGDFKPLKQQPLLNDEDNLNSLLSNWGKLGREIQNYMIDLYDIREMPNYFENGNDTLLHKIQNQVLNLSGSCIKEELEPDESLLVLSCVGKQREAEVLFDHVLNLLDKDKELKPSDIAVVAPDINDYKTILESVFMQRVMTEDGSIIPELELSFF